MRLRYVDVDHIDHPYKTSESSSHELISRALDKMVNLKALEWLYSKCPIFHTASEVGKEFSKLRVPGLLRVTQGEFLCINIRHPDYALEIWFVSVSKDNQYLTLNVHNKALAEQLISCRWPHMQNLSLTINHDHGKVPTQRSVKEFIKFHVNLSLDGDSVLVWSIFSSPCIPPRPLKKIIGFPAESGVWQDPERIFQATGQCGHGGQSSLRIASFQARSLSQLTQFSGLFPNVECLDLGVEISHGLWDADLGIVRIPSKSEIAERLSFLKNLRVLLGVQLLNRDETDEETKAHLKWIDKLFPHLEFWADYSSASGVRLTRRDGSISWKWVHIQQWEDCLLGKKEEFFSIPEESDQFVL
ncbi:hypothetical protein Clacol_004972 [Clathrus columnatus]|uniref:Uncharacterized protein n=1 Tax=Clathrus columnatus TaxID=1419009 RepID=A0AAV5ACV6_9AGAM|nr:hypothetical protein Clacol_004972 [Clathrus columnatus]